MADYKVFRDLVLDYVSMGNKIATILQDYDLKQVDEEYLSATEIEKRTNIPSGKIRRWAREGKLLKSKMDGARQFYCLQEVLAFTDEQ